MDATPPVITITSPEPGTLLNTTWVEVTGSVDKTLRNDLVVINGLEVPVIDGEFDFGFNVMEDGTFDIEISGTDLAGNQDSAATHVVIDTLPPTVQVTSPSNGHLTNQLDLQVTGLTEAGAMVTVSDLPAQVTDGTFSIDIELIEGTNVIKVVARDEAGNTNSTGVTVELDTVPPDLVVSDVVNGTITTSLTTYMMTGTTEPGATLRFASGGMDFDGVVHPDGSWNQDFYLEDELTAVTVTVTDPAGNTAWTEVMVQLLVEAPPDTAPVVSDPVVVTLVSASTIIIVGAALVSIEFTKYSLMLLFLPLYARIKRQQVLDNKTRLAIHGLVVENPGMHYNEIIREFDLTNGVAAYHLDVLEREGFVRSVRDGTLRRFFSTSTKVPSGFKMTPDQMRERIIDMVEGHPGINQKAIVDELGIGRTLVGYHLKTLKDEGYLKASRQGRFTVYTRTKKRWFRNA
jgi:DNA-binding transcriptional ArsR family regulator